MSLLEVLPPETQNAIAAETLADHKQHHMPISVYTEEMGVRADLLREHAPHYLEKLGFDVNPLADTIDTVKLVLLQAELQWTDGEKVRDGKTRFWYGNKEKLYSTNREVQARLTFHFTLNNNDHALSVLNAIGTSDNDHDAIHDGRRNAKLLADYGSTIPAGLYSAEAIQEMIAFYGEIEEAKEAAEVDRTAANEERILRDKIYCYLRKLETQVRTASKACFVHDLQELSRYESPYWRNLKK